MENVEVKVKCSDDCVWLIEKDKIKTELAGQLLDFLNRLAELTVILYDEPEKYDDRPEYWNDCFNEEKTVNEKYSLVSHILDMMS